MSNQRDRNHKPKKYETYEPRVIGSTTHTQLKDFRRELGMSVSQFACFLGVAGDRTVRRWELGTHAIPQWIDLLIEAFRLSPQVQAFMLDNAYTEWKARLDDELIEAEEKGIPWPQFLLKQQPPAQT